MITLTHINIFNMCVCNTQSVVKSVYKSKTYRSKD